MAGKPYAPIYDLALAEAEGLLGRAIDRARVLCVGDGITTDVRGAMDQGLDCLFIAAGIHGRAALGDNGRLDPARAEALLASEAGRARFVTAALHW
jgi:ribonucleotide monophosphatase NagD (HAD superfamily)